MPLDKLATLPATEQLETIVEHARPDEDRARRAFENIQFYENKPPDKIGAMKRAAAKRLAQLYRIGRFRRAHGFEMGDVSIWLYVLASTILSVPTYVEVGSRRIPTNWFPLDDFTLRDAALRAGLIISPEEFDALDLTRLEEQLGKRRVKHLDPSTGAPKPMRKETIASLLQITEAERRVCRAFDLDAFDETPEERAARQAREDAERVRARRRANGARSQEEIAAEARAKRSAWEEEGLSKSQYYERQKAEREGRPMRRNRTKTGQSRRVHN